LLIINYYNNKFHRIIGLSPNNEYKVSESKAIKKINSIKEKEFARINNKRTYLEPNTACLLNSKFIKIGQNTLFPTMLKKVNFLKK